MRIVFEQTGGLMGRKTSLTLNLDDLPDAQAETIRLLLDQAGFSTQSESKAARDQFHYQVMVESDDLQQTTRTTDSAMPASLRPLIEELTRLARTQKSG